MAGLGSFIQGAFQGYEYGEQVKDRKRQREWAEEDREWDKENRERKLEAWEEEPQLDPREPQLEARGSPARRG